MPYPYPYAYPVAWVPSNHPGIYERPEEAPRLDLGALLRVAHHPKDAFRDLYGHTDARAGVIVYVLVTLAQGIITLGLEGSMLSTTDTPGITLNGSSGAAIVGRFVMSIVTSLVMFVGVCYLTHALLKGGRTVLRPSLPKTIGLLGYAELPAFVWGVITIFVLRSMTMHLVEAANADEGVLFGYLGAMLGLGFIGFIWTLWVQGHAVSVANDAPWGKSAGVVFAASLVMTMVVIGLNILIAAI